MRCIALTLSAASAHSVGPNVSVPDEVAALFHRRAVCAGRLDDQTFAQPVQAVIDQALGYFRCDELERDELTLRVLDRSNPLVVAWLGGKPDGHWVKIVVRVPVRLTIARESVLFHNGVHFETGGANEQDFDPAP